MKKFKLLAVIAIMTIATAKAQWWFNGTTRFGWKAPTGLTTQTNTFPAYQTQTKSFDDTLNITVLGQYTNVSVSDTASSNTVLNITTYSQVQAGAEIYLVLKSGTTARSVITGSGVKGGTITGTANHTNSIVFKYDGVRWLYIAKAQTD